MYTKCNVSQLDYCGIKYIVMFRKYNVFSD